MHSFPVPCLVWTRSVQKSLFIYFSVVSSYFCVCDATRERLPSETICCMDELVDDGISGSF